ncbi:hypothetical protein HK100_001122 [Physocladia obscura]|uniref:Uncharacterized protein n=1 Tax=Physocladia obscura TaxID=109957 RepID=A0AAD5XHF6_9FUNG|nr:hypothetical protein HK100_001122 [Physocladia obscura]
MHIDQIAWTRPQTSHFVVNVLLALVGSAALAGGVAGGFDKTRLVAWASVAATRVIALTGVVGALLALAYVVLVIAVSAAAPSSATAASAAASARSPKLHSVSHSRKLARAHKLAFH